MPPMMRAVALACLVAGCALASEPRVATTDAGDDNQVAPSADAGPDAPPDACVPATEVCNGSDDDCDGSADEELGLGMPCDGTDSDACNEGMIICDGNGGTTCSDVTSDAVELCNSVDDDCQNGVDDPYPVGGDCTNGLGACARPGKLVCNLAMTGTTCNATPGPVAAEVCGNGVDEDCNGADAACPVNDAAAGAIDISAGGTFTVDLTASHDDNWAASTPALDCGEQGGRDAFYQFTLPAEEVVYFDTLGSNFDSVIRVFAGACSGLGSTQACTDDSCGTTRSQGAVNLPAGTYCLVVDQFSSNTTAGSATFVFLRGGRPGVALASLSGSASGTTAGKANLSSASCEANSPAPDVGHFFPSCPGRNYAVTASTCTGTAFDSVLYLRSGAATTADKACSDDASGCGSGGLQSKITGAIVSGATLQWLIVDGFGTTGSGNYTLTYNVQ
jgi:hypothetical protein